MFWFEIPKQHFDSADGDYKVPWIGVRKGPWQCQPIEGLSMDKEGHLVAEKGNAVAEYVMQVRRLEQLRCPFPSKYENYNHNH